MFIESTVENADIGMGPIERSMKSPIAFDVLRESTAATGLGDRGMERVVEFDPPRHGAGTRLGMCVLIGVAFQLFQRDPVNPSSSHTGRFALQDATHFVDLEHVVTGKLGDDGSAVGLLHHEAVADELPDCFPNGRATDLQPLRKTDLANRFTLGEFPCQDQFKQLFVDRIAKPTFDLRGSG